MGIYGYNRYIGVYYGVKGYNGIFLGYTPVCGV